MAYCYILALQVPSSLCVFQVVQVFAGWWRENLNRVNRNKWTISNMLLVIRTRSLHKVLVHWFSTLCSFLNLPAKTCKVTVWMCCVYPQTLVTDGSMQGNNTIDFSVNYSTCTDSYHWSALWYNGEIRGANRSVPSSLADNYHHCNCLAVKTIWNGSCHESLHLLALSSARETGCSGFRLTKSLVCPT